MSYSSRLPWAYGFDRFGNDELPDHLLRLAKMRANQAVEKSAFTPMLTNPQATTRLLDAAIAAGSAIEILAKHYLATISPALILETRGVQDTDVLHAVGRSDLVPREAKFRALNLKTRGPRECLKLIGMVSGKGAQINEKCADRCLDARNAAIHLGLVDRAELQEALANFAQVIDLLLDICCIERADFWNGHHLEQVDRLAERKQFYEDLDRKLGHARDKGAAAGARPATTEELAESSMTHAGPRVPENSPHAATYAFWKRTICPACGAAGFLYANEGLQTRPVGEDFETRILAIPDAFYCESCELMLTLPDELRELHLAVNWLVDTRPATDLEVDLLLDEARSWNDD